MLDSQKFQKLRKQMVNRQIFRRGIESESVLSAMEKVPRHQFMPTNQIAQAYHDRALPIGFEQTISQPYVVAYMISCLKLKNTDKVLEIGTGSGYQTAILA